MPRLNKDLFITVRVDINTKVELEKRAEKVGLNSSELVRKLIDKELERKRK